MNENKTNIKKTKNNNSSSVPVKKDVVKNNEELYATPNEGACSPEFSDKIVTRLRFYPKLRLVSCWCFIHI